MDTFFQLLISGLALGAVYALVALGFVLVYKGTDVLNFAHGELLMLGSYFTLTLIVSARLPFVVALLAVAAIMALLGVVLHYGVMRHMIGEPLFSVVLVTIGLAIVIRGLVLLVYGPLERGGVRALPTGDVQLGSVAVPIFFLILLFSAALAVALLLAFFRKTRIGLQMRAVAENLEAAAAMGVSTNRVFAVTWGIAALCAGVGGALYSNYTPVISIGLSSIGLRAFPAALVGGLDSIGGAIVGGLLIGVVEQLGAGYLGTEWRDVIAFGVMFVVLMVRPYGFFGKPDLVRI